MPSEDRSQRALAALAPAQQAFHGAVVAAVEELRGYIAAHRPATDVTEAVRASLGTFAAGRIDSERFGALFGRHGRLAPEELARLEQALETLREFASRGDDLYRVAVPAGSDLRDVVRNALAARGRVFAVARGAEQIRSGRGRGETADEQAGFPFRLWNRAERQIAPPLVIEVEGGDLLVPGLAEYLEGGVKIVLVVKQPAPCASLSRLIAPHVFVQQTADPAALGRFAAFDGPAIAALVPAGSAVFTWDPSAGPRFEQRLQVEQLPKEEIRHAVGSVSVAQQQADLQWLRELGDAGTRSAATAPAAAAPATVEPADLLAAWLLRQTDLNG